MWSVISAAAISRAAQQLGRLTIADNPLGMPLNGLALQTSRTLLSTLPLPQFRPHDRGTNPPQPSQDGDAEDELFDVDGRAEDFHQVPLNNERADVDMQEAEQPPSANSQSIGAEGDRERTMTVQLRPAQGAVEN